MTGLRLGNGWSVAVGATAAFFAVCGPARTTEASSRTAWQQVVSQPEELWLRVTASASAVEFGDAFELTVERGWDRALRAEDWSDDVLAPLDLTLVAASRREREQQVEETRRYRARLFRAGEVLIAAPWFRGRSADGDTRIAFADDLRFEVASALDPTAPGPVELPGEPMSAPFSWRRWVVPLFALLGVGLGLGVFVRRRVVRRAAARAAVVVPADERATMRLAALRAAGPEDRSGHRTFCIVAASILRDYIDQRFDLGLRDRATEELLGTRSFADACGPELRRQVEAVLARCDLVKFAHGAVDRSERTAMLDGIEGFVRATRVSGPEAGSEPGRR